MSSFGVCDAEINLAVSHKASQRRSVRACVCVCVCGNIYTELSSRGAHVFSENLQAHLPESDQRGKGKKSGSGTRKKHTHTHTHTQSPTGA